MNLFARPISILGTIVLSVLLSTTLRVQAATPVPTPTPFVWPVRYVISGPSSAHPGDTVVYRIDYEGVADPREPGATLKLLWTEGSASFVSLSTLAGPEATVAFPEARQIDVVFPNQPGPGAVEIALRIALEFEGTMRVGIEVRGSGITMPEGSVLSALTMVSPSSQQPSPPRTGVADDSPSSWRKNALWLALAGFAAVGLSAAVLLKERRS
ncbi:MAG: hypothetical protein QME71_01320 [Dehalococcoidia bacterium]|nr:hypothetical protein [Dehalococcoidia bacterium]